MDENWFELLRLFHHSCDKHNTPSKVRRAIGSPEMLAITAANMKVRILASTIGIIRVFEINGKNVQ